MVPTGTARGLSLACIAVASMSLASSLPAAGPFANTDAGAGDENDSECAFPLPRMVQAASAISAGYLPAGEKNSDRAGELRRR